MRRVNVKISAMGAVAMTAAMCGMCFGCARGFGGVAVSAFIAAIGAALMLLANPILILLPLATAVVPAVLWREWEGLCIAAGAILAAVLLSAAFRRGDDLTKAGVFCGGALLAGTVSYVAVVLITQAGGITAGLAALKASFADIIRSMADQISANYGDTLQIYDSDIEDMISATVTVIPGIALFVYQLAGMFAGVLTASLMRMFSAGESVSSDGRWRCADSPYTAAVYILSQIFFGASALFTRGAVYYTAYNIMLAFLPAALAMGVRALFTRRGVTVQPMIRVGVTVLAAMLICYNPMAACGIIALAGSIAVLYRDFAIGWQKGMRQ